MCRCRKLAGCADHGRQIERDERLADAGGRSCDQHETVARLVHGEFKRGAETAQAFNSRIGIRRAGKSQPLCGRRAARAREHFLVAAVRHGRIDRQTRQPFDLVRIVNRVKELAPRQGHPHANKQSY
jgi:hypothetical protein